MSIINEAEALERLRWGIRTMKTDAGQFLIEDGDYGSDYKIEVFKKIEDLNKFLNGD